MDTDHGHATYRVPGDIAWIDGTDASMGEELYLTKVPDGHTVLLTGSARLIWLVAAEGQSVLPAVAELAGVAPSAIEDDVHCFLRDLTLRGLLTRSEGG